MWHKYISVIRSYVSGLCLPVLTPTKINIPPLRPIPAPAKITIPAGEKQVQEPEAIVDSINDVAKELGARASHIARAFEYYISGDYTLSFPFRYSDQLRNFEDMIRAAIADKKFEKVEQTLIKASYQRLGLSKDQLKRIYEEAKRTTKVVT